MNNNKNSATVLEAEVDAPINIDGNVLVLVFIVIAIISLISLYFYRQMKMGNSATERQMVRQNKQFHNMQMLSANQTAQAALYALPAPSAPPRSTSILGN